MRVRLRANLRRLSSTECTQAGLRNVPIADATMQVGDLVGRTLSAIQVDIILVCPKSWCRSQMSWSGKLTKKLGDGP